MHHVAIMKKSWGLIPKILEGKKTIESRWSKNRCSPWGKVKEGDTVYFKNSGEAVTVKAKVTKVSEFENINRKKILAILKTYGGVGKIAVNNYKETLQWLDKKKYCTLIYLGKPSEVVPFKISKKGFGTGCAWMTINDIKSVTI